MPIYPDQNAGFRQVVYMPNGYPFLLAYLLAICSYISPLIRPNPKSKFACCTLPRQLLRLHLKSPHQFSDPITVNEITVGPPTHNYKPRILPTKAGADIVGVTFGITAGIFGCGVPSPKYLSVFSIFTSSNPSLASPL